jgi:phosphate uptake regulator
LDRVKVAVKNEVEKIDDEIEEINEKKLHLEDKEKVVVKDEVERVEKIMYSLSNFI